VTLIQRNILDKKLTWRRSVFCEVATGLEVSFISLSDLKVLMPKSTEALKLIVIRPSVNTTDNVRVLLRYVRSTIVTVDIQRVLHILNACL
jgi:hypothetical protein